MTAPDTGSPVPGRSPAQILTAVPNSSRPLLRDGAGHHDGDSPRQRGYWSTKEANRRVRRSVGGLAIEVGATG
jgi:hypothetical protein